MFRVVNFASYSSPHWFNGTFTYVCREQVHLAAQTMNETGSLIPFSHHSASFHIKYPYRCITGKIAAQILLKLLLLVMKQLSLKMHHSLPPPFPHLYRLFPGCLLSFFSPPDSQYHPTGKRQQTLRMVESYLCNAHTSAYKQGVGREPSSPSQGI